MNSTKFQDMLGKVRALLAQADDPAATPAEADAYRTKAEALQFKYKIDLATAPEAERKAAHGFTPEWRKVYVCSYGSEFANYYSGIALSIVRHVDARAVSLRVVEDGRANLYINVVGFAHDLDYLELLLVGATTAFGKRMEPTVNPAESDEANAFRLRMGGMERHRIATAMFGPQANTKDVNDFKARNRRVTGLIKKGAVLAGEDPSEVLGRGNSIKTFRDSYASGFYYTLTSRLQTMAMSRGETDKGLVLKSLANQVEEEFFGRYPHLKPSETGRAEYIAPNKDCAKCAKASSGYCREHGYLKPSTAKGKDRAWNHGAFNKGGHAARTVDLGPGGTPKAPGGQARTELG